jgi:hypothetical protein
VTNVLRTVRGIRRKFKSFFFKTLYLWIAAFVYPLTISYSDFLILFAPSS